MAGWWPSPLLLTLVCVSSTVGHLFCSTEHYTAGDYSSVTVQFSAEDCGGTSPTSEMIPVFVGAVFDSSAGVYNIEAVWADQVRGFATGPGFVLSTVGSICGPGVTPPSTGGFVSGIFLDNDEVTYSHFRCDDWECASLTMSSSGYLVVPLTSWTNGAPTSSQTAFISEINVLNGVYGYDVLIDGSVYGVAGPVVMVGACSSPSILGGSGWVEAAVAFATQPSCGVDGSFTAASFGPGYIVELPDCTYLANPDYIGAPSSVYLTAGMYGASFSNGEMDTNGLLIMADGKPASGTCVVAFVAIESSPVAKPSTESYSDSSFDSTESYSDSSFDVSDYAWVIGAVGACTAIFACLAAAAGFAWKCTGYRNEKKRGRSIPE